MIRRLSAVLLCLVMLLQLCGCHGSKERIAFAVPESFDSSRTYEISFWAKNDTNKTQTAIYQKAIRDFEALYPNIKVNLRLYTDYGKIYNDVITNIATDTTPNVCITYPDHIATYMTGTDVVVPLDDLFSDPNFGFGGKELRYDGPRADEMIPEFLAEGKIGGISYAVPYMRSTEACYINKTMLEKLGFELPDVLTWDFVWEVSDLAARMDAEGNYLVNGQKVMIPFLYKSTDNMMIQYLRQKGAGYSTPTGEILIFNDDTEDFLYTIAGHVGKGAFSTFKISSYPANFLNAGQCLFAVDSTAGATWMGSDAPLIDIAPDKLVSFETAVRPIPQLDPGHPLMISQGPSLCIFNKADPQTVLASWLFTQFLLTNDVQIAYAETEGYVPVTLKARESPEYQDYLSRAGEDNAAHYDVKIAATKLLIENTANTFTTPVFNGSASLRDAAGQMIEEVTKSVRRRQTVDDAYMQNLFSNINSLYRLDQIHTAGAGGPADLGPLPKTAVVLLSSLAFAWVLIALFFLYDTHRQRKKQKPAADPRAKP
ncbi:MAG: extracellular solute-binding protein [Oscillospiraceae bacterium]|nr:extracellular solute-binding protein [Oscillospiraceae bacterium]